MADQQNVVYDLSNGTISNDLERPLPPVRTVRDLGVYIDSDLGAATHVRKTVSCCFAALRQLRHLRH